MNKRQKFQVGLAVLFLILFVVWLIIKVPLLIFFRVVNSILNIPSRTATIASLKKRAAYPMQPSRPCVRACRRSSTRTFPSAEARCRRTRPCASSARGGLTTRCGSSKPADRSMSITTRWAIPSITSMADCCPRRATSPCGVSSAIRMACYSASPTRTTPRSWPPSCPIPRHSRSLPKICAGTTSWAFPT